MLVVCIVCSSGPTLSSTALSDHHGLAHVASRLPVHFDRATELSVQFVAVGTQVFFSLAQVADDLTLGPAHDLNELFFFASGVSKHFFVLVDDRFDLALKLLFDLNFMLQVFSYGGSLLESILIPCQVFCAVLDLCLQQTRLTHHFLGLGLLSLHSLVHLLVDYFYRTLLLLLLEYSMT